MIEMPEAAPLQPDSSWFYQQAPGAPQQPAAPPNAFGQPQPLPANMQR